MLAWPEWLTEQFEPFAEVERISVEEFEEEGKRREGTKTEKPHYFRQEFRYGAFVRKITLPAGCSEEDVAADYADGILTIRLPLAEEKATATKIPVTRG